MAKNRWDQYRVFAPEFFRAMSSREGRWRTECEASTAGPFRVLQRDDHFVVLNDPEPDDGDALGEFSGFLEAAGGNVLANAAKILERRLGFGPLDPHPTAEVQSGRIV